MTAKEYLSQARWLDEIINSRLRELEYWKRMAGSVSGMRFDGMPHNPNRPTDAPFVRCIEKIEALERDINRKIDELVDLRKAINARLDAMENNEERLLLHYRYLDGFPWEKIESMMNISERTAFRIHGNALEHFSVPH